MWPHAGKACIAQIESPLNCRCMDVVGIMFWVVTDLVRSGAHESSALATTAHAGSECAASNATNEWHGAVFALAT